MFKTVFAAALLSAAIAAPAFAQDKVDLGGFYAGGELGYGKAKHDIDFTPKTGAAASGKTSKSGFEYQGFVGYGAMARLMEDPACAQQLRAQGLVNVQRFTWAATAEKTLAVYQEILNC